MKSRPYITFERWGTVGHIRDEATYEKVRLGVADWKPHIKARLTHIEIPIAVFNRLIELDKRPLLTVELSKTPLDESEVANDEQAD